ncbi:MAG TPA: ferritin-like fold-containing protein [Dermatophilaceae bacterium]|nr:ferritin-like fold-containing protein [Dermatophilaceae bacterium]
MSEIRVPARPDDYRAGVIDLMGALAYGELAAFSRRAEDAAGAPTLADRVMITSMAATQFDHFEMVRDHLWGMDVDVMEAMTPFHPAFDSYHSRTRPRTWLEGLVTAFVGDGLAGDFYREVAAYVDSATRDLVHQVLADAAGNDYAVGRVRQSISDDPAVAGRLALWARRLVGEALSEARRVAVARPALTALLSGTVDRAGTDLAAIERMLTRLVETHTLRMERLGLAS